MTQALPADDPGPSPRPLIPVTILPGMCVYDVTETPRGEVVAITQAYCIYRLDSGGLCIAAWHDIALGNVRPTDPLLPTDITENDKLNTAATALRELIALQQVASLTAAQSTALDELIALLRRS